MQRHRLVGHLAVRYFLMTLAALMVFGWWAAQAFNSALTRSTWTELEAAANLAAADAGPLAVVETGVAPSQGPEAPRPSSQMEREKRAVARIAQNTHTRITVILADGRVILDTSETDPAQMENHANRPEVIAALAGNT